MLNPELYFPEQIKYKTIILSSNDNDNGNRFVLCGWPSFIHVCSPCVRWYFHESTEKKRTQNKFPFNEFLQSLPRTKSKPFQSEYFARIHLHMNWTIAFFSGESHFSSIHNLNEQIARFILFVIFVFAIFCVCEFMN